MKATLLSPRDHSRDSAGLRYVYPVVSRRAGGVSVGINLNPNNACNWRCIYCQVPGLQRGSAPPIDMAQLGEELRGFLHELLHGDFMQRHVPEGVRIIADIAVSGNGEPTSALEFPEVIRLIGTVLSDTGLAGAVMPRVITNGSLMSRGYVTSGVEALAQIGGEVWFKVDAGTAEGFARINSVNLSPEQVIGNLQRCAALCPTWVQTCVFAVDGNQPSETEVAAYLGLLKSADVAGLRGVLLYGLARPSMQPEAPHLSALPLGQLEDLATRIQARGLTVRVNP